MIPRAGSFKKLKLVDEDLPPPGKNEVQVQVKAIGLNFADIFAVLGLYGATPEGSFIPGLEYSGIVLEVGEEVSDIKPGQNIMGVTRFGAYTTQLNIEEKYVMPLPEGWTFEEGAAYLVQVLTAYYALSELGNIKPGATVLIQSAAGGVGIWANRIAKQYDAYTIGCVGSRRKLDLLRKEGYDRGFVRGRQFKARLREALGDRELNLVLECIGGRVLKDSYNEMSRMGRMIVYGSARYAHTGSRPNYFHLILKYLTRPKIDPQKMIENNKSIMGFNLIYLFHHADLMHDLLDRLDGMSLGKPLVGHHFQFEQMKEALLMFQAGNTTGKVVISV
jgi:alcohol dehydrogenase